MPGLACSTAGPAGDPAERKLAIESSVGWSKRSVGASSASSRVERAFTSSATDSESRPADIKGAFVSTRVPSDAATMDATDWRVSHLALVGPARSTARVCRASAATCEGDARRDFALVRDASLPRRPLLLAGSKSRVPVC